MKSKLLLAALLFVPTCYAKYPDMSDSNICNGYPTAEGIITRINSTTTYNGYESTYINLKVSDQTYVGGKLFYRKPVSAAYDTMVDTSLLALATGYKVKLCYQGDTVYAVELIRE